MSVEVYLPLSGKHYTKEDVLGQIGVEEQH